MGGNYKGGKRDFELNGAMKNPFERREQKREEEVAKQESATAVSDLGQQNESPEVHEQKERMHEILKKERTTADGFFDMHAKDAKEKSGGWKDWFAKAGRTAFLALGLSAGAAGCVGMGQFPGGPGGFPYPGGPRQERRVPQTPEEDLQALRHQKASMEKQRYQVEHQRIAVCGGANLAGIIIIESQQLCQVYGEKVRSLDQHINVIQQRIYQLEQAERQQQYQRQQEQYRAPVSQREGQLERIADEEMARWEREIQAYTEAQKSGRSIIRPKIKVTDNEVLAVIYNRGKLQGNLECKPGQDKIVIDKYWYPVFQKGYEAGCRQVIQGEVQPGAAMIERKYWPPGSR